MKRRSKLKGILQVQQELVVNSLLTVEQGSYIEEKERKTTNLQSLLVCVHLQKWERRLERKESIRGIERDGGREEVRERDLYISREKA